VIAKKHSGKMMAVSWVGALGKKLPIIFSIGGSNTRKIAKEELKCTFNSTTIYIR
jgi:hypothetical protein